MTGVEWKIFVVVILWNIASFYTFSNILSQFDDTGEDEILVKIRTSTRTKRSTNGDLHPDRYELNLTASGDYVHLDLQRNDRLSMSVPTILMENGQMRYEQPKVLQEGIFYQDTQNGASFFVFFARDKFTQMYGVFQSKGSEFILQTNKTAKEIQRDNLHRFKIKRAQSNYINDDVIKSENNIISSIWSSVNRRQKRAAGSYTVELLIVVDYAIYQRWYATSTGTTTAAREAAAVDSIRQYYAFVINGMDAMYKSLQTSSFTISVVFAGIVIAKTSGDAPWTETIKITSVFPYQVEASTVLTNFQSWVKGQSNLPGNDHAMLFTGYEMTSAGSPAIAGYAVTGAVCTERSVSVVEDKFNFIIITVASHELGHSLSALHDGDLNSCLATDAYIMTSISQPQTNPLTVSNPWKFSSCSLNYFTTYINRLETSNDRCMTTFSPSYNSSALSAEMQIKPGQLYNADQQCANIVGAESYLCRNQYSGNYASICNIMWCSEPNNQSYCQSYIAGDGTLCGNKKWCISGVCTPSSAAPSGSESCLYGDQKGRVFSNGWTCAQMVKLGPNNCGTVATQCCESCFPTTTTKSPFPTAVVTGQTSAPTNDLFKSTYVYIIVGVSAFGFVVVVIVVICCCCCRKKPATSKKANQPTAINRNQLSYKRHSRPRTGYVNRAMVYDNAIQHPASTVQRPLKTGYVNRAMVYDNAMQHPASRVQRPLRY